MNIVVDDTGDGMTNEDLNRLLVDPRGSGRGIVICKHLLNSIGGHVCVSENKPVDAATRIVASIPVAYEVS